MNAGFQHIDTWVFDLDNTLYPPRYCPFDQMEVHMVAFIMDHLNVDHATADHLRTLYHSTHGTTMAGLMHEHGMDPHQFLLDVHDIDFSVLPADPFLAKQIKALPGRKIVYTNGTAPYAGNVIAARGLTGLFNAVYGIEHAQYCSKPSREAFDHVFTLDGFDPARAVMVEDAARNLVVPHDLGMVTVHIAPQLVFADYIHHHGTDLSDFLTQIADIPAP